MLAEVSQGSFLDGSSIPTAIHIFREQQGSQCKKSKKTLNPNKLHHYSRPASFSGCQSSPKSAIHSDIPVPQGEQGSARA